MENLKQFYTGTNICLKYIKYAIHACNTRWYTNTCFTHTMLTLFDKKIKNPLKFDGKFIKKFYSCRHSNQYPLQ